MMVLVRSDSSMGASPSSERLQISSRRIRSASNSLPFGLGDVCQAQPGALAVRVGHVGHVGGGAGLDQVAGGEGLGDDDESDVGDPAGGHEVDPVAFVGEPGPAVLAAAG